MENIEDNDNGENEIYNQENFTDSEITFTRSEHSERTEQISVETDHESDTLLRGRHLFTELSKSVSLTKIEKQISIEEKQKQKELRKIKQSKNRKKEEELAKSADNEAIIEVEEIKSVTEDQLKEFSDEVGLEFEEETEELTDVDKYESIIVQQQLEDEFFDTDIFEAVEKEEIIELSQPENINEIDYFPTEVLEDVIETAIKRAEGETKRTLFLDKINRNSLINRFMQIHKEIIYEQNKNQLLDRAIFDHFRRKKHARALIPDNPEKLQENLAKYEKRLLDLDDILCRNDRLIKEKSEKLNEFLIIKQDIEKKIEEEKLNLKKLIFETGLISYNDQTGKYLNNEFISINIMKIFKIWEDINNIKFETIYAEYQNQVYEKNIDELENFAEGYNLTTYEVLRAEAETAEKALQDRCTEIFHSKTQCDAIIETIAHIREKIDILQLTITEKLTKLNEVKMKNESVRKNLVTLQCQRNKVRKKHKKLVWEAGLRDKPTLLHDYDKTVEQIRQISKNVSIFKQEIKTIENQINKLTKTDNLEKLFDEIKKQRKNNNL